MAEASISVDLFNPGQVFACLGFLEAADVLLGDGEGGFDWSDEAQVRFLLRAAGDENPFAVVLQFLAEAAIACCAPAGYVDPPMAKAAGAEDREPPASCVLRLSEYFPNRKGDRMALPVRLEFGGRCIDIGHWADGSSRNNFKLYSGNRSAHGIASAMLCGTWKRQSKKQNVGDVRTQGVKALWELGPEELSAKPFDVLMPMGGSFNFDPRGAWTSLDTGYSLNQHKHRIAASPVVEILAACGLEHARPDEYQTRHVRYGAWGALVPPLLARAAVGGARVGLPVRAFRFVLDLSGKNKVVTFAQEETS